MPHQTLWKGVLTAVGSRSEGRRQQDVGCVAWRDGARWGEHNMAAESVDATGTSHCLTLVTLAISLVVHRCHQNMLGGAQ